MQSLRDKLLKAGLVSEEAAKKAEADKKAPPPARVHDTRRDERPPRRDERAPVERPFRRDEPPASRLPKFAPLPGTKEAHRLQAKKQLEADKQLRERVLATQVAKAPGDTPFFFVTRKNKLRRLEVSAEQAKELETGVLAIIERPDPDRIEHSLIPAEVAKELLVAYPKAVRFLNAPGAAVGFLSESEISERANEAHSGETHEAHDAPEPEPNEGVEAPDAERKTDEAAATFITIKRAPK
jgi:uncharacterized protein YaiL (DUF2058 family)